MKHHTDTFTGFGDLEIFCQAWLPDETLKAALIIVHGIGEHSGRYMNIVNHLVPHGFVVYGYDSRGHGQSAGKRGHIESWEEYRGDLHAFVQYVRKETEVEKLFLLGHSMGGLVTLDYVLHHSDYIRGIVVSSPALDISAAPPGFILIANILNRIVPGLQLATPLDTNELSRDPTAVKAYMDDPLVHNKITPRFILESVKIVGQVQKNANQIKIPILVTFGEADQIVPIGGTKRFFKAVASVDKQLITYPEGRHEPHNDFNSEEVVDNIARWLDRLICFKSP